MLTTQKYTRENSIEKLEEEFGLVAKHYDDRVVLNYKVDSKPKFHPIIIECRGLILSKPDYNVLCRSFDRFFNYGEGDDKDTFDWDNCLIFNKLDGSLINVYHDGIKWCAATRGTAYAEGTTPMGKSFDDLFLEAISVDLETGFEFCSKDHTYIFELTSPENRVVTRYRETRATLLAIRSNITGIFVDYSMFTPHIMEFEFDCDIIRKYDLKNSFSPGELTKFVESRDAMDEGIVCYDPYSQKRIKIKNSSYVAIHRLKGEGEGSLKSFVDIVFKGEEDELLVYFPEFTDTVMKYKAAYDKFINDIKDTWNKNKHIENQKDFALVVKDLNISGIMFSLKKGRSIDDIIEHITIDKKIDFINKFMV